MAQFSLHKWQHIALLCLLTLALILPGFSSLPIIDRDEARYAQASIQMVETGDYVNIKFQDQARHKKPAGIYWLQSGVIHLFGGADAKSNIRQLWMHRLPSLLGALLAVIMSYWGCAKIIDRQFAFISAALLASSLLFIFEGHIAKTDAVLCGLSATLFAALLALQAQFREHHDQSSRDSKHQYAPQNDIYKSNKILQKPRFPIWLFWTALGLSIMIKGPILAAIIILCLASYRIFTGSLAWARPLLYGPAIIVFVMLWLPWTIYIYIHTDGGFLRTSLGHDLGGKLFSVQEKHAGPPGYHLALLSVMLWPASLFIWPALFYAVRVIWQDWQARKPKAAPQTQSRLVVKSKEGLVLAFMWITPFWLILELMPTKLPHYSLPVFPAFCLIIALSLQRFSQARQNIANARIKASPRRIQLFGIGCFMLSGAVILSALLYLCMEYGTAKTQIAAIFMVIIVGALSLIAAYSFYKHKFQPAISAAIMAALSLSCFGYGYILPNLDSFNIAARIARALGPDLPRLNSDSPNSDKIRLASPHFIEPSLVYHLGTSIKLGGGIDIFDKDALKQGRILLIDLNSKTGPSDLAKLDHIAAEQEICLFRSEPIQGFNYTKGKAVAITIVRRKIC